MNKWMTGALGRPSRWSLTARMCVCACCREGGRALYQRTRDAHVKRCRASTVEETRDIFFQYAEEALPMEDGHITETPIVEDDGFADEDDFDFDVTPSRFVAVDENDPISVMYMAALRLDAILVRETCVIAVGPFISATAIARYHVGNVPQNNLGNSCEE